MCLYKKHLMEASFLIRAMLFTTTVALATENVTIDNTTISISETNEGITTSINETNEDFASSINETNEDITKSTNETKALQRNEFIVPLCLNNLNAEALHAALESGQLNNITITNAETWNKEFHRCPKLTLMSNEFCAFNDSRIFVPMYGLSYNSTDYFLSGHSVFVCLHFSVDDKIEEDGEEIAKHGVGTVGTYLTIIGISVSNICLALHFLAFVLIAEIRNLPGNNLAALTVAVFFSNLFFLIAQGVMENKGACITFASFTLFFFLSSFLWMSVIGFETWRSLKMASTELRLCTKLMGKKRYIHYSLYAWLTPLILVCIVLILDNANGVNEAFQPGLGKGKDSCWFSEPRPAIVFFIVPLVMVMASNLVFFMWSAFIIYKHTERLNQDKKLKSLIRKFSSYGKLAIITGLTWITGIVAFAAKNVVTWYIFLIFTTFYGSFIFVSFTCTKKVYRHLGKRFPVTAKWFPSQSSYLSSSEPDTQ